MVRIPQYSQFSVDPSADGRARARQTVSDDALATPGRQLQALGDQVQRTAGAAVAVRIDRQTDINEGLVREADNRLSATVRAALLDPERGFLNTRGGTALERAKATREALETAARETGSGLQGVQQAMYQQVAQRRLESALGQIDSHTAQEARRFNADQAQARVVGAVEDGVAARDPAQRQQAYATAMAETDALSDLQGLDAESREQARLKTGALFHGAVIDTLDDPIAAMDYLDQHKAAIAPTVYDRFKDALAPAVRERHADLIAEQVRGVDGMEVKNLPRDDDLAARLAAVDKMNLDPALAREVKQRVTAGVNLDQSLLADQRRRASDRVWEMLDSGQTPPTSLLALASPGTRRSVRAALSSGGDGTAASSRADTRNEIRDMIVDDPRAFERLDLNEYRSRLTASDYDRFRQTQRSMVAKGDEAPERVRIEAAQTVARQLLPRIGIDTGRRAKPDDQNRFDAFVDALDTRSREFATAERRPPTRREVLEMADQLLIETKTPDPTWYSAGRRKTVRVFELPDNARGTFSVAVPPAARQRIIAGLRARGIPQTENNIARVYVGSNEGLNR